MVFAQPGAEGSVVDVAGRYANFPCGQPERQTILLDDCQQTKNLLVSYLPTKLGFF